MKTYIPGAEHDVHERVRRPRAASVSVSEQRRAIVNANKVLALRKELDARITLKQRLGQPTPQSNAGVAEDDSEPGTEMLIREAHQVLLRYLPAVALPDELWTVRAMLDAHMFGRDGRTHRDDVVQIARRIDLILSA